MPLLVNNPYALAKDPDDPRKKSAFGVWVQRRHIQQIGEDICKVGKVLSFVVLGGEISFLLDTNDEEKWSRPPAAPRRELEIVRMTLSYVERGCA